MTTIRDITEGRSVFSDDTFTLDDSKVRKQNKVSGRDAYILIYERSEVIIVSISSLMFLYSIKIIICWAEVVAFDIWCISLVILLNQVE